MAFYREDIVDIELTGGSVHRSYLNQAIGGGDALANRFGVRLFRDGEPVNVEDCTVTAVFMAPDGTNYVISETSYSGSTGKSENVAYVILPAACYAVNGQFCLAIKLLNGSVEGTMRIVDGTVCDTGEAGAVVPTSTIPTTEEIIAAYEAAVAIVAVSVRFDTTQSLTTAQKEKARENIDAVSTGEMTETIDETNAKLDADLGEGRILEFRYGAISITDVGTTIDMTSIENVKSMKYAIGDCEGAKTVYTHIYGGGTADAGARAYAFLDEDAKVLSRAQRSVYVNTSLTVPEGAKYVILQTRATYDTPYAIIGEKTIDKINGRYDISSAADIQSNDDLNEYITPGSYVARSAAVAQTIDNSPTKVSFYLVVMRTKGNVTDGASIRQILIKNYSGTKGLIYTRYQDLVSSGWSQWERILTDGDITSPKDTVQLDTMIDATPSKYNVRSTGKWQYSDNYRSVFVRVPDGIDRELIITGGSSEGYVTMLTSAEAGENNENVTNFAYGVTGRNVISANSNVTITVPDDCKYILVLVRNSGTLIIPKDIKLTGHIEKPETWDVVDYPAERAIASDANGMDIPQVRGIYNAIRKAHQLKEVEWTPINNVPGRDGVFPANVTQNGIPYSSVKEYDKYVGWNVSLRTFMTALHNPYSMIYTEDVLGTRSTSAYGKTYHGTNCGTYFGIVCNAFALYSNGWEVPWNTAEWAYLNKVGRLVKEPVQSVYGMHVGDLVWEPGHGNIILDIRRNSRGEPVTVDWAESRYPTPRITTMTVEDVNERLNSGDILYYDPEIYKNTEYTPSEFVAVEDEETPPAYQYNDDICTFAGDYACFNSGEDIYINYNYGSDTYPNMEIYKGDTLLSTLTLDTSEHAVKITTSGYGKYKARLKNGNTYSDYTYFEIVDTALNPTYENGLLTIPLNSANGIPMYAQLTFRSGESLGIIPFTESNRTTGYVKFEPLEVLKSQYPDKSFNDTVYIKVFFKGEYGVVPNEYTDTGIV